MKNTLNKIRYIFFGRQIQKSLERSEMAGREASDYQYLSRIKALENDLKALKIKHEREVSQLVNKKMAELNHTVNPDEIMRVAFDQRKQPIGLYIGKELAPDGLVNELKSEAQFVAQSKLWKILHQTPKEQAHQIMFEKSESYDDMRGGKFMLLTLDLQDQVINTLTSFDNTKTNAL